MEKISFIMWSGYTGSGSSAAGDYLKEFENVFECGKEIRFVKDPYGLIDLEEHLLGHWELINSVAAINDFLNACKIWARYGDGPLCPPGLSYGKHINKNFYRLAVEFIESISSFSFKREFYHTKFKKPYLRYVIDRNRNFLERKTKGKLKISNRHVRSNFFCLPTQEEYTAAAQDFIFKVFSPHIMKGGVPQTILLDQPISPNHLISMDTYFPGAKMIVVDRDPRDMYVEEIEWGLHYAKKVGSREDGLQYVERMKGMRHFLDKTVANVLFIRFEDLILKYEETTQLIRDFVGFGDRNHVSPFKYLDPKKSVKNVGMWKKYKDAYKEALDAIKEKLPDLCYEEN